MKLFFQNISKRARTSLTFALIAAMILGVLPVCAFAGGTASLASAALVAANGSQNGMVRVFLSSLGTPSTLQFTVQGSYTVNGKSTMSISSGATVTVGFNSSTGKLTLTKDGTATDMGNAFKLRRHQTGELSGVKIAQARVPSNLYPGDVSFVVKASGSAYKLYTIIYVYIEDYLYGVLPYEMGNGAHIEALKAQAVSARTYTLRAMTAATSALYDVVDTTSDQVYNGTPSGYANCKAAVDATKGIVSMNGSSFTGTWYTASNGGQIESVKNLWGSSGYSYIRIKDDPYDLANPDSRVKSFTVNASGTQGNSTFSSLLNAKAVTAFGSGASVTGVTNVVAHTPKYSEPSRLYTKLDFYVNYTQGGTAKSGTLTFSIFDELESPLGMSISTAKNELWSVTKTSAGFLIEARRYGHGTGLSQRGAMYMGKLGYTYDQIMAFYFEGCKRVQYTFTNTILSPVVSGADSYEMTVEEEAADITGGSSCTAIVTLNAGETLPVRAAADSGAAVLTVASSGAEVYVLGASGTWCLVQYGSIKGYAQKSALTISGTIPSGTGETVTALYGYGETTSEVNLRAGAGTSSAVLTLMPKGAALPLISVSNGWAYTQYGRLNGYVSMSYVTKTSTYPGEAYDADANSAEISAACSMYLSKSTTGYVIKNLAAGTEVALIGSDGSWAEVRHNHQTGYVLSANVTRTYHTTTQAQEDTAAAGEYYVRVINSNALNLRAAASGSADVLTEMPLNALLIAESSDGTWTRVRYRGVSGYAMNSYLAADTASGGDATDETVLRATVTTESGSLNLRQGQSTSSTVLTYIPKGTVIVILEKGNEWSKTTYDGYTGYVLNSYLTFIEPTATPTPTPSNTPTDTTTDTPATGTGTSVRVTAESAAIRNMPLTSSAVLATAPKGAVMTVVESSTNWICVVYGSVTGYVQTQDIEFVSETPAPSETDDPGETDTPSQTDQPDETDAPGETDPEIADDAQPVGRVITSGGELNIRLHPLSNSKVVARLKNQTLVTIYEIGTNWYLVEYEGVRGYAQAKYIKILGGDLTKASAETVSDDESVKNTGLDNTLTIDDESLGAGQNTQAVTAGENSGSVEKTESATDASLQSISAPEETTKTPDDLSLDSIVVGEPEAEAAPEANMAKDTVDGTDSPAIQETSAELPAADAAIEEMPTQDPSAVQSPAAQIPAEEAPVIEEPAIEAPPVQMPASEKPEEPIIETPAPIQEDDIQTEHDAQKANAARDKTLKALDEPLEVPVNITSGRLNLRAGCDTNSDLLMKLDMDATVLVVSRGKEWCEIEYKGVRGFVMTKFLLLPEDE